MLEDLLAFDVESIYLGNSHGQKVLHSFKCIKECVGGCKAAIAPCLAYIIFELRHPVSGRPRR
jgi:hypothetical protein